MTENLSQLMEASDGVGDGRWTVRRDGCIVFTFTDIPLNVTFAPEAFRLVTPTFVRLALQRRRSQAVEQRK